MGLGSGGEQVVGIVEGLVVGGSIGCLAGCGLWHPLDC